MPAEPARVFGFQGGVAERGMGSHLLAGPLVGCLRRPLAWSRPVRRLSSRARGPPQSIARDRLIWKTQVKPILYRIDTSIFFIAGDRHDLRRL